MKKTAKGKAGYVRYEKIRRLLIMLLMFAIPIGIYISAYIITGSNRNIMTIVAIVGIVPAARFAVSWIMIMMMKDADPQVIETTERIAGGLVHGYELMVTAYEGRMPLDAVVVCGNEIVCISTKGDKGQFAFMEKHISKILNSNNYFNSNVRIFPDLKHYEDRIRQLAADPEKYRSGIAFKPDEQYPDLNREQLIFHTIMAVSV